MRIVGKDSVGFSLVELSIVLVILGLLTGGILTGQSLIKAAELRSVSTEYQQWQTAVNTFQQKYFALPGDMPNATSFWGSANGASCSHGSSGTGTGTQTCNGDGSGSVTFGGNANAYNEMFMFWQHLANAQIINGTFSGKASPTHSEHAVIGTNVPASKFPKGGWTILADMVINTGTGGDPNPTAYGATYRWPLYFGAQHSDYELHEPVMKPEDAWNIDTKMDDGVGTTGKIVMDRWHLTNDCRNGATPMSYNLNNTTISCVLIFRE